MTDSSAAGSGFRVGAVISRAISVYFGNVLQFLIIGILAYVPLIVVFAIFGVSMISAGAAMQGDQMPGAGFFVGIALMILTGVLGWCLMSAGVTYGVITSMRQGRVAVGEALGAAMRAILPLVGLGIIMFAIAIGMMLIAFIPFLGIIIFIVLGLYLAVRWWVVIPAMVVEGIGPIAGLGRSSQLTAGNRWKVLAVAVLWALIAFVVSLVVGLVLAVIFGGGLNMEAMEAQSGGGSIVADIISGLVNLVFAGLGASVVAVAYHDLRIAHEGGDTEQIARAFD